MFKEKTNTNNPRKKIHMIEMEIMFSASFYKASNTLMPKSVKGTPKERKYRLSLMNIDEKLLRDIPANWV